MNTHLTAILSAAVVAFATNTRAADSTITLTGVHNCCKSCANGIEKAVTSVKGATASCDGKTVTITAKNSTDAKKAAAALLAAGYYGDGAPASPGSANPTAAPGAAKAKSVTVEGPHLCCGKCVTAFNDAVKSAGASGSNAAKGSKSVTVEGEVSPQEIHAALNKAGFNGKVK